MPVFIQVAEVKGFVDLLSCLTDMSSDLDAIFCKDPVLPKLHCLLTDTKNFCCLNDTDCLEDDSEL